jgi:hypothetical protein
MHPSDHRPATRSGAARLPRGQACALVLLACGLLLGGLPGAPGGPAPATPGTEVSVEARIRDVLSGENASLSAAEVDRIAAAVMRQSERYELDPELVTAVLLVESSARPWARSPKGARGLMQVMPYMMRPLGLAGNLSTIETNVEAGCMILAGNIERLGEADGISAYFWGSDIRGAGYLERVRAAQERLRESAAS